MDPTRMHGLLAAQKPAHAATVLLVAAAFNQISQMLRGSLKAVTADPQGLCAAAGIDPTARAEALSA